MADDARISTAIRNHPKTRKLQKRLGKEAVLSLIWLFLYAAESRTDGNLVGMTSEDIELAADWEGEEGKFTAVLSEVGFLDGESGTYTIHDWNEHNPYAATRQKRVEAAREANRIRWERERDARGIRTASEPDASRTKADSPPPLTTTLLNTKETTPPNPLVTEGGPKEPKTSKRKRRTRTDILAPYPPEVGELVNELVEKWPAQQPGDGKPITADLPKLAERVDALLREENVTREMLIGSANIYLSDSKRYYKHPHFFFGMPTGDSAHWSTYARMWVHQQAKGVTQ